MAKRINDKVQVIDMTDGRKPGKDEFLATLRIVIPGASYIKLPNISFKVIGTKHREPKITNYNPDKGILWYDYLFGPYRG